MISFIRKLNIAGFLIIISGLFYYQVIQGDYFSRRAQDNFIRLIPKTAPRGIIYDRNGTALVKNVMNFQICVFAKSPDSKIIGQISRIIEVDVNILKQTFKKNYVAKFIPTPVYSTTKREKILKLEEKNLAEVAIRLEPTRKVVSPYSLAHLVGYTRKLSKEHVFLRKYGYSLREDIGYAGIERYYDDYLRGKPGGTQLEVDSYGRTVNMLSSKSPVAGKDLYTTIDLKIQNAAFDSLKGYSGTLILTEADTGKIIAMASRPSFDINLFTDSRKYLVQVSQDPENPLLYRAIQGTYPLGSVFKPAVALAGLQEGKISEDTKFLCTGQFRLQNSRFKCWSTHGWQDLIGGLLHSCNVYFYNTGVRTGPDGITSYAKSLGLGELTNIDIPFEKKGLIPTPKWKQKTLHQQWYTGDTVNLSIGQGYTLVTPIQVQRYINFFATGGYLVQPYIVSRIDNIDIPIRNKGLVNINIKNHNIGLINKGLREAVDHTQGTAHILEILDMKIAGKTGTAQVARRKSHGWFAGFFPYPKPKYSIVVMLENSGSSYHACRIAYKFLRQVKKELISDEK